MKFSSIIDGLLEGKNFCCTNKNDEVHYYITFAAPINEDNVCLCIVYFEDLEDPEDDIDPEPYEILEADFTINTWRLVKKSDYFTEENKND